MAYSNSLAAKPLALKSLTFENRPVPGNLTESNIWVATSQQFFFFFFFTLCYVFPGYSIYSLFFFFFFSPIEIIITCLTP